MSERLRDGLDAHLAVANAMPSLLPKVAEVGAAVCRSLAGGGKLIAFGNGGSAADAQHFAAELIGHFRRDRRPLPAIALTSDSSVVTAIANDYAYPDVFARQVAAVANGGDVVVGISTSGDSENVLRGLLAARQRGAPTVALIGQDGRIAEVADHVLAVPSGDTARVQEMHILLIHLLSEIVDEWAAEQEASR
ncbi:MAG: SIS domain-containing protein [Chloroflexota bacterium]|nr:SIS domain-containing protein [Chloroflexota bacterium]